MKSRRRDSGFTLVELAVAVTVASVALVSTAGAVTAGAKLARTTAETRTAMRTCSSIMERIRATPMDQIKPLYDGSVYDMNEIGGGPSVGECAVAIEDIDTGSTHWGAYHVTITCRWEGIQGQSSQSVSTWICDRAEGSSITGSTPVIPPDSTANTTVTTDLTGTDPSGGTTTTDPNAGTSTGGTTTTDPFAGTSGSTGGTTDPYAGTTTTTTDPNAGTSGTTTTGGTTTTTTSGGSTTTSGTSSGSTTTTTTSNGNGNGNGNGNSGTSSGSSATSATASLANRGKKK